MQNFSPRSTNRVFVATTLLLSFPYVVEIHSSTISTVFIITWQLIGCKMGVFSTLFHNRYLWPSLGILWLLDIGKRCGVVQGLPASPALYGRNVHSVLFCPQRIFWGHSAHFVRYRAISASSTFRYSFSAHSCSGVERFQRVLALGRVVIEDAT